MLNFGIVAFAAPWVLLALAALPVLWWLLRVTPPAPKRVRFPAIRLLFRLHEKEDAPAHTPWWLLLLRLIVVTLLIVGLAQPLLNPGGDFQRSGPLVLVVDNGWSSAANWQTRRNIVGSLLEKAERQKKEVILLTTAPPAAATPIEPSKLMTPRDAAAAFKAMIPQSWPVDQAAAAKAVREMRDVGDANVVWLSDGLEHPGTAALAGALQRLGAVAVMTDPARDLPVLLHPARLEGKRIVFRAERPDGTRPAGYWMRIIDEGGHVIGRRQLTFKAGERTTDYVLKMPSELRNRIARIELERHNSAGATLLLDERLRRRPVGMVAAATMSGNQTLLSSLYYLQRALSPYAEVRRGPLAQLLQRPLSVVFLADSAPLSDTERKQLVRWIAEGGVLVRFAGPVLASTSDDTLVPVKLRGGDRSFGGAMSWTKPAHLAPFDADSPFAGLDTPKDVTVTRQVLAEPSLDLARKTWARLQDGTPLVTAAKRGKGMIVLFHTTANPTWSNLSLAGLFVRMLRRVVALSRGVADGGVRQATLTPYQVLDGFGRLVPAPESVLPVDTAKIDKIVIGPDHPPGLYGDKASRRSINLGLSVKAIAPLSGLPAGISRGIYRSADEVDLKPMLLAAALALFLFDMLISFFVRGLIPQRSGAVAAALIALCVVAGGGDRAQAQTNVTDQQAIRAVKQTVLAYVRTGDAAVDRISRRGLIGLGRVLRTRTSVEPGPPIAVDPDTDELAFYPVIYWPVTEGQTPPNDKGVANLQKYLRTGGMIIFDVRIPGGLHTDALRRLVHGLKIPALMRVPSDHVLTRSYYLLQRFPGRWANNPVWVARRGQTAKDGVSPVVIGANDWASAWATDDDGRPLFPVTPGGALQREYAYRAGVNLVMYALTGNYKSDQVHIPTILRRLGQ
jgi:hypothetical protein